MDNSRFEQQMVFLGLCQEQQTVACTCKTQEKAEPLPEFSRTMSDFFSICVSSRLSKCARFSLRHATCNLRLERCRAHSRDRGFEDAGQFFGRHVTDSFSMHAAL